MNNNKYRFIHLLYVPTMACNMACKYCYLEENTKDEWNKIKPLETLEYAIEKFFNSNCDSTVGRTAALRCFDYALRLRST